MPVLDQDDFMIVSMARSGTNFLREVINSVDCHHCLGEIFRKHGDSLEELSRLLVCSESQVIAAKNKGKAEFWRQIRSSPKRRVRSIGAKLFYYHADWDDPVWHDIHALNIIHLIRGNALELFVSIALANRSNIWKSKTYDSRYDEGSIVVPAQEFLEFRAKRDQNAVRVRERYASSRYLEVFYEDLVEPGGPQKVLQKAFGATGKSIRPGLKKQRRRPLEEVVANYSEVAEFDYVEYPAAQTGGI